MHYRLDQAGNAYAVEIDEKAQSLIYRFTGGYPGPINKLCGALLSECCEQETRIVGQEMVRTIAGDLEMLPHVFPLHGRVRRQADKPEERITERRSGVKKSKENRATNSASDIKQLYDALTETRQALRESEEARSAAIADLKQQQRALEIASASADKARSRNQDLDVMNAQLEATVEELKADLRTADKLGVELDAVEKQLEEATSECESLRPQALDKND
jgi:DNA repair exonuclease SbcCD ATPase subunit